MRWRTGRGPLPHSPPRRHRILRREAPQRSVRGQVIRLRQRGPSWLIPNDQFADKPFVFDNEDLHGLTPFTEVSLASHSSMTLANSGHRFTGHRPLGLTSANRFGNLVHPPRLGHEVNVACQGFLANVAGGENDLDIGTSLPD